MNRRNWRRHYKWFRYIIPVIVTIVPVTPTILEPIAPGCVEYGPECVIDYTAGDTPPVTVVEQTDADPYPLIP